MAADPVAMVEPETADFVPGQRGTIPGEETSDGIDDEVSGVANDRTGILD